MVPAAGRLQKRSDSPYPRRRSGEPGPDLPNGAGRAARTEPGAPIASELVSNFKEHGAPEDAESRLQRFREAATKRKNIVD